MSSSSKSSTTSSQNYSSTTQDNRVVADAGALVFSQADGNTINSTSNDNSSTIYNTLDAGAVGASYDFAEMIAKGAASQGAATVGAMQEFGIDALTAVKGAYKDSSAATSAAYKDAMGGVTDIAGDAMSITSKAWGSAFGGLADNTKMSVSAIQAANAAANAQIANANRDVADAYKGVNDQLSDAWKSSKAGEQKMLAFGLLAIVGLGFFKVFGGR